MVVIAGTSIGALFGSTITWWLIKRRLFRGLERLLEVVEHLAQQVDELHRTIDDKPTRKSGLVSSLDDDTDIYEDAYGGSVFSFDISNCTACKSSTYENLDWFLKQI